MKALKSRVPSRYLVSHILDAILNDYCGAHATRDHLIQAIARPVDNIMDKYVPLYYRGWFF